MSVSLLDDARRMVADADAEMQSLKRKIRALGDPSQDVEENTLQVVVTKVTGLPETAQPSFALQLSSPIEELTVKPSEEAKFRGVEISNATIVVSAKDLEIELGSSQPIDVAPFCSTLATAASMNQEISILPPNGGEEAVCSATLQFQFQPSVKDQREELYDLLNKASERKSKAMDELRAVAERVGTVSSTVSRPAVRPGFLNSNSKGAKPQPKWKRVMSRTWGIVNATFPYVWNYVFFFGTVLIFHFQGQQLALPPPV